MKTNPLTTSLLLAGLLALPVSGAMAAALGDVVVVSAIGEPLRVELRTGARQAGRVGECVRVLPGETRADGIPAVRSGRVSGVARGGDARIVVTEPTPVFDPIIRLTLEEVCDSRLQREYTLLLPYPGEVTAPTAAQAPREAAPPAPRARAPRSGRTWTTAPGESADSLARSLYPDDPATQRRFVAALRRSNPELLPDPAAATRALPPGSELAMPDLERLSATATAAPARAPRAEAPGERAPRRTAAPAPTDRLVLAESGSGAAAGADAERMREERLVAAIDRSIATQLELMERIRQLEQIQAALAAQVASMHEPAAREIAPAGLRPELETRTPAPAAAPAKSRTSGWTYLALLAALGGTLAFVLSRLRPRRSLEPEPTLLAPVPEQTVLGARSARTRSESLVPPAPVTQGLATSVPEPSLSSIDWDLSSTARASAQVAPIVLQEETAEEHESAIELAEIMMGFGRVHGAAETLAEFIHANPKQSVTPWIKLLEVYRAAGLRPEFDGLARQLNKTFNVKAVTWESFDEARTTRFTIEQMPHAVETIQKLWGTPDCQAYLQRLLRDNRDGTRQGFPLAVIDEILLLSAVLEQELGPYRASDAGPGEPTRPAPEQTA